MKWMLIAILTFAVGCSKYPDDNFIEELAEDVIEDKTGFDIDLSPWSPEEEEEEEDWSI